MVIGCACSSNKLFSWSPIIRLLQDGIIVNIHTQKDFLGDLLVDDTFLRMAANHICILFTFPVQSSSIVDFIPSALSFTTWDFTEMIEFLECLRNGISFFVFAQIAHETHGMAKFNHLQAICSSNSEESGLTFTHGDLVKRKELNKKGWGQRKSRTTMKKEETTCTYCQFLSVYAWILAKTKIMRGSCVCVKSD